MAEKSLNIGRQYTLERMIDVHLEIFKKIMDK